MKTPLTFIIIPLAMTAASPAAIILNSDVRLLGNLFFPPAEFLTAPYDLDFDVNGDGQIDFGLLKRVSRFGDEQITLRDASGTSRFVYSPDFVASLEEGIQIGPALAGPSKEFRFINQQGSETMASETQSLLFGEFLGNKTSYLGFEFQASTGTHYGYAKITDQYASGFIIESVAWDSTPGQSILTGALPEPTTSLLLGMTLAASVMRRKRRASFPV